MKDYIVWTASLWWCDIEAILKQNNKELYEVYKNLSDAELKAFRDEHEHDIVKGIEAGIMSDWTVVVDTALDGLKRDLERRV